MIILVSGDRWWGEIDRRKDKFGTNEQELLRIRLQKARLFSVLDFYHAQYTIDLVIEGCAKGADKLSGKHLDGWATLRGVQGRHFPADWNRYGKSAGPIRNREMAGEGPDIVFAFHDNIEESKGTKDMLTVAEQKGIPYVLFTSKEQDFAILPRLSKQQPKE